MINIPIITEANMTVEKPEVSISRSVISIGVSLLSTTSCQSCGSRSLSSKRLSTVTVLFSPLLRLMCVQWAAPGFAYKYSSSVLIET